MRDLVEALTIFLKYGDKYAPTGCEHDVLYVYVEPSKVSQADLARLESLGFRPDYNVDGFSSFRFGSA